MHYEGTMQLVEAYKQNPVQGTIIVLLIFALLAYLVYVDKKKKSKIVKALEQYIFMQTQRGVDD